MTPVEIIHLQSNQWEQYRKIRLEALQNAPQAYSTTYQEMVDKPDKFWQDRLVRAAAEKERWLLFAQAGKRMIGIIGAYLPENSQTALIVSVYVTPDYRGKGVSCALMEAILNELRQKNAIKVVELAVTRNQEAAFRLYRRFGFEVIEEKENQKGNGQVQVEYVMQRKI